MGSRPIPTRSTGDNVLLVSTKSDLRESSGAGVAVSAVTGDGLGTLRLRVAQRIFGDQVSLMDLEPALTRARHRDAPLESA